ncbi:hypothetical protein [Rhizobium binae]|uniref:Uncharacterized protein n=1 Tax=Rhizobium binae TaxID=1138190 RepID=A0ABV2MJX3_9HYPH|nr:hypothetical protein [Rhizobium binae]NKL48951.1 hypothetical protein [Rhizobium leguminosarum bv. viciae]MBX4927002.1 hypothetical protein [Rhizobium binae]MBX4940507.1 hypothetical protein [Rhizobium binae]MBX4947036.1 hypothetical protein [Rhizobium binae]MBX4949927.1 hypothetical protein [Rhizobium binae]
MTLQALRLSKKVDPSPDRREQDQTEAVYGETGEYAMNDNLTEALSLALFAGGCAFTAVV